MDWGKIITGLIVGTILGISGTIYTFNERLSKLEAKLENAPSINISSGLPKVSDKIGVQETSCRVIFSNGLSESKEPKNSIKESIIGDEIVIYTYWYGLTKGKSYHILWKIKEPGGSIVSQSEIDFVPPQNTWNSWTSYKSNKGVDKSGTYTVSIFLNDEMKMTESIFLK